MSDPTLEDKIWPKVAVLAWIVISCSYAFLLVRYPEYWAVGTAIVFILVSGLITTKVVLDLESPLAAFGLAPLIGTGWLLLLWLLFKLAA